MIKRNYKYIVICLILLACLCQTQYKFFDKTSAYAYISSSEIVMEVNSKRVLHESNAYEKKFMASTTKILTALVIIENCNLSDVVTVTKATTNIEGSSIYLEEGEQLSVKHLLYGLMLRSGNDCAETLAVYCSKSIDAFAKLMNNTAQRIGAVNSNFVNPHGLHDDNHYTTAYDLALISCVAMQNNVFREIVGTKSIKIPHTKRDYDRLLINKNKMLNEFDGSTGIKTGFTKKAGRCLVSSCVRNGMEIVSVVLNCAPMFERSKELLLNAFNTYELYNIIDSDNIIDFIPINNSDRKCGVYIKKDLILPLSKTEWQNLVIEYDYPKQLQSPIKKDQEIGFIKINHQNNLIFAEKIYTIIDVD